MTANAIYDGQAASPGQPHISGDYRSESSERPSNSSLSSIDHEFNGIATDHGPLLARLRFARSPRNASTRLVHANFTPFLNHAPIHQSRHDLSLRRGRPRLPCAMVTKNILEKNFKSSLDILMHSDFMRKTANRIHEICEEPHINI